jgi:nitroimidazol reductase NimA-like FMN-containing flavoprotein (pyridoxamine 5'-phosphate oxidase superfamily)
VKPVTAEVLDETECWQLLAGESVGRIAVCTATGADIFVVNYLVTERAVFFRSAPGTKLALIAASPRVAFEADGRHHLHRWSVVVRGTAHRIDSDTTIEESGVLGLSTATTGDKWNYVRIEPGSVTGRRV